MNTVWESLFAVCAVLAATELAGCFCSKSAMVGFVRALVTLVVLLSAVSAFLSLDWDFSVPRDRAERSAEELTSYVDGQVERAAEEEMEKYLAGLLDAGGIQPEKMELSTDIREDGSIVLTKVSAVFTHASDAERAGALLRNVLGDETEVEVGTYGR